MKLRHWCLVWKRSPQKQSVKLIWSFRLSGVAISSVFHCRQFEVHNKKKISSSFSLVFRFLLETQIRIALFIMISTHQSHPSTFDLYQLTITCTYQWEWSCMAVYKVTQNAFHRENLYTMFCGLSVFYSKTRRYWNNKNFVNAPSRRRSGRMVSALESWSSGLGLSPGRWHCVVFLSKILYSRSASPHPSA